MLRFKQPKPSKPKTKSADGADGDDDVGKEQEAQPTVSIAPGVADAGHAGYIIRSPYAEVAHFLVVRKMLERFKRVFCYMDASYDLTDSVMVAMHDWVSSGRAHVAVMQHEKLGRREQVPDRRPHKPREDVLPQAMEKMEERFAQCVAKELGAAAKTDDLWGDDDRERRARAIAWRSAPRGRRARMGALPGWPTPAIRRTATTVALCG